MFLFDKINAWFHKSVKNSQQCIFFNSYFFKLLLNSAVNKLKDKFAAFNVLRT